MVVPLIIDTDPGVDDVLGILMALGMSDEARIEAITLVFGNTTLDHCHSNILRVFSVLHEHIREDPAELKRMKLAKTLKGDGTEILLSKGAAGPLGGRQFNATYFHGRDGISGVSSHSDFAIDDTIPAPLKNTDESAHDVILNILRRHPPGVVRIAAVGPLTNIALAWLKDPETFLRVGGISVMGCTLDSPGNTTPVAEFNTYADPFAARLLLQDAPLHPLVKQFGGRLPIDVLPLDITTKHSVPFARLCDDSLKDAGILCRFRRAILARPRTFTNSFADPEHPFDAKIDDNFSAHDPLAILHAIHCPSWSQRRVSNLAEIDCKGWCIKTKRFGIETEGSLTRGMCVVDRRKVGKNKVGGNRSQDQESQPKDPDAIPQESNGITSLKTAASTGIGAAPREKQHHQPFDGEWDVVVASPGVGWFAEVFCSVLGV